MLLQNPKAIGRGRGLWKPQPTDFGRMVRRYNPRTDWRLIHQVGGRRYLTTENINYNSYTAMTVTNLQSLANDSTDPFSSWQSARVDNTATKATDYEVQVLLSVAATAPANDQSIYVYVVPWVIDGSSAWTPAANFGTTTRPTGSEGTASISDPNSMKGPLFIPYKITSQPFDVWFTITQMCGPVVPDGWSLAIRNCTGAALGTGCVVCYRPINYQSS